MLKCKVGFTLDLKLHLCYYSNVKICVESGIKASA